MILKRTKHFELFCIEISFDKFFIKYNCLLKDQITTTELVSTTERMKMTHSTHC